MGQPNDAGAGAGAIPPVVNPPAGGTGEGTGGTGAPPTDAPGAPGTPPAGSAGAGETGATGGTGAPAKGTPDWYEAELVKLRHEAAQHRVAGKAAADAATAGLVQTLGKALGFVKDETTDPAELAKQAAALGSSNRELTIEVATLRAAPTHGASPVALADSRTFMLAASKLDPTAATFAADLEKLIKETVASDKRFAATTGAPPPAAPPAGDFSAGNGAQVTNEADADVEAMRKLRRGAKTA